MAIKTNTAQHETKNNNMYTISYTECYVYFIAPSGTQGTIPAWSINLSTTCFFVQ